MYRFLCKELLNFNAGSDAATTHLYCLQTLVSLRSISTCSLQNPSSKSKAHPSSTTVSYLMKSLGLSPEKALSISSQIQLRTTENPDSVLTFLRDHGFTKTQITRIITWRPSLLFANPEKTLKTKWDFFHGLGLSGPALVNLFAYNPDLFQLSLEKKIIPSIEFLKTMLHTTKDIYDAIKFTAGTILDDHNPNLKTLKDLGMPDSNISRLLVTQPRALLRNPNQFNKTVGEIKGMGLDPSSLIFVRAVAVMSYMSKAALERKQVLYRSLGWSDHEILAAVRKNPNCLAISDNNIKQKVEFFVNKLGFTPAFISERPMLLMYNFEKRTIPRCSVFEVLKSRGIIKTDASIAAMLAIAEGKFHEKYVIRYEEAAPEVVRAFQGMQNL